MTLPRRVPAVAVLVALGCSTVFSDSHPAPSPSALRPPAGACRGDRFRRCRRATRCAEKTRSSAPTSSSSMRASTRSTPSSAAPAGRRRPEACNVLEATALWWRIQLDPESRALDAAFTASVERAIRTTEAWTERAPQDRRRPGSTSAAPTARACSGGCCAARRSPPRATASRSRRRWSAPIALEPGLDDAYFGLGMYKYYADVAPAAARVLRFLLLLPGGDRKEGLREMLRARSRGRLVQGEADYQLHVIYLWYERQTERAIELLRRAAGPLSRQPALSRRRSPQIQDAYRARHRRQPRNLAAAARRGARTARQQRGARRSAGAARRRPDARRACA